LKNAIAKPFAPGSDNQVGSAAAWATAAANDEVTDESLISDAGSDVALITDFDEALDAAIPRNYRPILAKGLGRFSGKGQRKGSSETRQLARIVAVCSRYKWPSPTFIMLRGVSGWLKGKNGIPHNLDPKKSALGRFLAEAEAGKVPAGTLLIVDNPDRFSRTNLDAADHALMTLLRNGVSVLFLSMQMLLKAGDQDNVEKRKEVMNELSRANREGNTKSKYVRDGITDQIRKARAGQRVNFGGKIPRWIKWDANAKDYKPNGQKWTTVCRIVKEALEHKIWGQIVRDLNADKVPCLLGGKFWQHISIYQLLRNPALRGDFVIRNETLRNYLPAIITGEAQWNLLQARLAVKTGQGGGSRSRDKIRNLFPGLVVCHHCGMGMRTIRSGAQDSKSYVCMGHIGGVAAKDSGKPVCANTRVLKVQAIELDFFGLLIENLPSTLLLQRDEVRQAEITRIRAEITSLAAKITRLGRLFSELGTDTPELRKDMETARDEITRLQLVEARLLTDARVDSGVDAAWKEAMDILQQHSPAKITDAVIETLLGVSVKLRAQLADNDLRRKLIGPLKMLVAKIEVDVNDAEMKYRAQLVGGGYTEWRDVSQLNASLIEANRKTGWTPEARRRMSQVIKVRNLQRRAMVAAV
jgi:hypothetical protein